MLLSDNFSQLRAVQFLAWFANIIGESELTWERKKWQLRDGAGNNSKSTFILWLEDRKGSKSWAELESGWGKELGCLFFVYLPHNFLILQDLFKNVKRCAWRLNSTWQIEDVQKSSCNITPYNSKVCAKQKNSKEILHTSKFSIFLKEEKMNK